MTQEVALEFLCRVASGISDIFGDHCETVVHEMDGQHIKNIALYNGHVSSRVVGSTLSIYGNDTSFDNEEDGEYNLNLDYLNQLVITSTNKQIKSSTFHLRGDDYHYALGINFDITLLGKLGRMLDAMTESEGNLMTSMTSTFQPSMEDLFDNCLQIIGRPVDRLKKADRLALVTMLQEKGFFQMRRSVPYAAERLEVSKYTIYNYINEIGVE